MAPPVASVTVSKGGIDLDWNVALVTFGLIFFAELGDKTQLATMTMAAQSRSPVSVFIGSAAALVLTSLLGVLLGDVITRVLPARFVHIGAGGAFILLGILLISGKLGS